MQIAFSITSVSNSGISKEDIEAIFLKLKKIFK
jgi:hypothetical protein